MDPGIVLLIFTLFAVITFVFAAGYRKKRRRGFLIVSMIGAVLSCASLGYAVLRFLSGVQR